MSNSSLRFTSMQDRDAEECYISIAHESLLGPSLELWRRYLDRIGRENMRLVYSGETCAGGLGFYRMGHVFGGSEVRTAGVSGVAMDPAFRGTGICGALLRRTLQELRGDGYLLASLFASTQRLYRSVGFEQAGSRLEYTLPLQSLPRPDRTLACKRYEEPPMQALDYVHRLRARRTNGNLVRTDGLWDRLIRPNDGRRCMTYLFGDQEKPEGFIILKQADRNSGLPAELVATDYAVNSVSAMNRMMSVLHDHRSIFDRFRWWGGPEDPLLMMCSETWAEIHDLERWMLRVLDVSGALETRGYGGRTQGVVVLDVTDELLPENQSRWRVEWEHGNAKVSRIPSEESGNKNADVRLDARALAILYSGLASASQLQSMEKIACDSVEPVELLDAAFAGPSPWVTEMY